MESTPAEDAKQLYNLINGKNKDDNALIKLVTSKTKEERLKIKDEYNSTMNSDLIKDLQNAYSHHFKDVLVGLFYSPLDYDCYHILKAVKGIGTDEDALIEILATRTSEHIEEMKSRYKEMYPGRDMVNDIKNDTSGSFWEVLKALLENKRGNNTNPDLKECEECAKKLIEFSTDKKNNVEIYTKILTEKSKEEIILIGKIYHKFTKSNILADVQKFFSGDTKKAFEGILYGILSPSEYFAKLVYNSIKGLGTRDTSLIRILITRDEIDMPQIKQFYKSLFEKDMVEDIKNDTSGNYQKILVELAIH